MRLQPTHIVRDLRPFHYRGKTFYPVKDLPLESTVRLKDNNGSTHVVSVDRLLEMLVGE